MKEKVKEQKEELTKEEKKELKYQKKRDADEKSCVDGVNKILKMFNCVLAVNPKSTFSNPSIVVKHKK